MHPHWRLLFGPLGTRYRVHIMKIYLLTVLCYIHWHMISIYQPNKVDKLTLLSRSFKLEVREFVAWDYLVWISGPTISVAKCCALSLCKTKGCKHLDGKKRCTYWQPVYKYTFYYSIAPYIPIYFPFFHLFISSWKPTIFVFHEFIYLQHHPCPVTSIIFCAQALWIASPSSRWKAVRTKVEFVPWSSKSVFSWFLFTSL